MKQLLKEIKRDNLKEEMERQLLLNKEEIGLEEKKRIFLKTISSKTYPKSMNKYKRVAVS